MYDLLIKAKDNLSFTKELQVGVLASVLAYFITQNFTGYNIFLVFIVLLIGFNFLAFIISLIYEYILEWNRLKKIEKIYNKRKEKSTVGGFLEELNNFLFVLEKNQTVKQIEKEVEEKYFKVLSYFIDETGIQLKTAIKVSNHPGISNYKIDFNIYNKRREKIGFAKVNVDKSNKNLILTMKECEKEEEIYNTCSAVKKSIEVYEHEVALLKQNYSFSDQIYEIAKKLKNKLEEEISNGTN